jgi:hypothetical protein
MPSVVCMAKVFVDSTGPDVESSGSGFGFGSSSSSGSSSGSVAERVGAEMTCSVANSVLDLFWHWGWVVTGDLDDAWARIFLDFTWGVTLRH